MNFHFDVSPIAEDDTLVCLICRRRSVIGLNAKINQDEALDLRDTFNYAGGRIIFNSTLQYAYVGACEDHVQHLQALHRLSNGSSLSTDTIHLVTQTIEDMDPAATGRAVLFIAAKLYDELTARGEDPTPVMEALRKHSMTHALGNWLIVEFRMHGGDIASLATTLRQRRQKTQ